MTCGLEVCTEILPLKGLTSELYQRRVSAPDLLVMTHGGQKIFDSDKLLSQGAHA